MRKIYAALLTGVLLALSWPSRGEPALLFVAFIPLLSVWDILSVEQRGTKGRRMFLLSWCAFLVWNGATTYWIGYAHWSGAVFSALLNSTFEALAFCLSVLLVQRIGKQRALISLPAFWYAGEYIMENWDLDWPWLQLGNAFASRPEWVQWYSYTGAYGGTLWVWVVNLLLFTVLRSYFDHRQWKPLVGQTVLVLGLFWLLPVWLSARSFKSKDLTAGQPVDVVVVQPNLDAYTEKFNLPQRFQTEKFLNLASPLLADSTDFLVGPETFISGTLRETGLKYDPDLRDFRLLNGRYPGLATVVGATTAVVYDHPQGSPTARPHPDGPFSYDVFNTALQVDASDSVSVYHKSKLVAGVEKMPYRSVIEPTLGSIFLDMGGTTGSLGSQEEREVFVHPGSGVSVGTAICYESVFPDYFSTYISRGANLMFIITNDGWWGNSEGHRQHLMYARLRAIETNRWIARSANTGISAMIAPNGSMDHLLPYGTDGAFAAKAYALEGETFFVKNGNLLGRLALFLSVGFLLYGLSRKRGE